VTRITVWLNLAMARRDGNEEHAFCEVLDQPEDETMFDKNAMGNVGIMIATNTALFTGLDLGQWIADTLALWALPANIVAAVIATTFALGLTAAGRVIGLTVQA
jgi:hypothetical protein